MGVLRACTGSALTACACVIVRERVSGQLSEETACFRPPGARTCAEVFVLPSLCVYEVSMRPLENMERTLTPLCDLHLIGVQVVVVVVVLTMVVLLKLVRHREGCDNFGQAIVELSQIRTIEIDQ
jgi:hypothetical protein